MNEMRDIYLRAHTVVLDQEKRRSARGRTTAPPELPKKWPDYAVVFGCESGTGITQELTFGFYRVLKLNGDAYVLEEEGGFFDDDLPLEERKLFGAYFRVAVSDKTSFPPNFPRLTRSDFIRKVFYRYARQGAILVGFDLPYMRSGGWPGDGHPEIRKNGRSCCRSTRMVTRTRTTREC